MNKPFNDPHFSTNKLHVISIITNPVRYKSRYALYQDFAEKVEAAGALHYTAEGVFGDRTAMVTDSQNPRHFQFRTWDEIWHKENLINLAIQRLPADWEYVAWVDADIQFLRPDWITETVHQLQHHHFVQMWQSAVDTGPTGESMALHQSFGYLWTRGLPMTVTSKYGYGEFGHPGFAWAARREAIEMTGGLLDEAIVGAGDHHMAWSLVGKGDRTYPNGVTQSYKDAILRWQDRAKLLKQDVGFVPGTIVHGWHGKKTDRNYIGRWEILIKNQFDPLVDIKRDSQGLWQFAGNKPQLRDDIRRYFRQRNEDSIDLE